MVLTAVLSMIRYIGDIEDRDFVDRMHSYFTTNILIAFSILVSFKQFGGKPVECLVPDIFSGSWEQVVLMFIFIVVQSIAYQQGTFIRGSISTN